MIFSKRLSKPCGPNFFKTESGQARATDGRQLAQVLNRFYVRQYDDARYLRRDCGDEEEG